jgi:hypothetical protein
MNLSSNSGSILVQLDSPGWVRQLSRQGEFLQQRVGFGAAEELEGGVPSLSILCDKRALCDSCSWRPPISLPFLRVGFNKRIGSAFNRVQFPPDAVWWCSDGYVTNCVCVAEPRCCASEAWYSRMKPCGRPVSGNHLGKTGSTSLLRQKSCRGTYQSAAAIFWPKSPFRVPLRPCAHRIKFYSHCCSVSTRTMNATSSSSDSNCSDLDVTRDAQLDR